MKTVFWTVVTAAMVLAITELIKIYVFEPNREYRRVVASIDYLLKLHANKLANINDIDQGIKRSCSEELRNAAAELESAARQKFIRRIRFSLQHNVKEATGGLIFLANYVSQSIPNIQEEQRQVTAIRNALAIK